MGELLIFWKATFVAWALLGSIRLLVYGAKNFPWKTWFLSDLPSVMVGAGMGIMVSMPN